MGYDDDCSDQMPPTLENDYGELCYISGEGMVTVVKMTNDTLRVCDKRPMNETKGSQVWPEIVRKMRIMSSS